MDYPESNNQILILSFFTCEIYKCLKNSLSYKGRQQCEFIANCFILHAHLVGTNIPGPELEEYREHEASIEG